VFGGPEILILVLIIALVVGYRYLPRLGRSAGKGLRSAGKGAQELSSAAGEKFDQKVASAIDPAEIGRTAGRGVREARELKHAITNLPDGEGERSAKPEPTEPSQRPAREQTPPPPEQGA